MKNFSEAYQAKKHREKASLVFCKKEPCKLNTGILSDFCPTLSLDNFVWWKGYPITYRMLLGMADKYAMGLQQAAILPLH